MKNFFFILLFAATAAAAQQWPNKPIRWVVPYPPGGSVEIISRIMQNRMLEGLGQPIVIETRGGAGGSVGTEVVARSAPDGYTFLFTLSSHTINPLLYKLSYDIERDFAPVSLIVSIPQLIAANSAVPIKTMADLVAAAKAQPGKLSFASIGNGTPAHIAAELLQLKTGIELLHIPYKGGGPAVIALVGGQCSVGFATTPSVISHVKSGRLRGLAVTSAKRSPSTPELPTVSEAGMAGYESSTWYGFLVPARTSGDIVARLHAESVKLLKQADVRERIESAGFETIGNAPEEFAAYIRSEIEKWSKVVKASGARAD